jgi:hypothetical protein
MLLVEVVSKMNLKPEDFGLKVDDLEERAVRFAKQREERGWDDSETWSLFVTLSEWIVPRLKRFKELNNGHPSSISCSQWDNIIDRIIEGFELIIEDDVLDSEKSKKRNEAMDLFREWFFDLWW